MPKREFDRRSGTGRGKEIRKQGAGKGGWGTTNDELVMMNEPGVFAERKITKTSEKEIYGTKYLNEVQPNSNRPEDLFKFKPMESKKGTKMSLAAFQAIGQPA
eukprot:CAMPEP_0170173438 /NCGR_PEP_ID=MMETSP0040_2-20121228/6731_1 /TAXON_ID=641309 /ORGANISM="Lotharella oceanica, Strain CCMP622" /LENGTH=102 /DNA_ID=CAMNT_0010414625 /DNA_START=38 /DNA_END=346 /DNA_ORIENTATION=-